MKTCLTAAALVLLSAFTLRAEDGPARPGAAATAADWANYQNAVAAWNQRTAAAEAQQRALTAPAAQIRATEVHLRAQQILEQARRERSAHEAAQLAAWQRERLIWALSRR